MPEQNKLPPDLARFLAREPGVPGEEQEAAQIVKEEIEESPTVEANGDDLADMFKPPSREDADIRADDLVRVTDEDVYGEGGEDMSDLVDVSAEDIMGEDPGEPPPPPQPKMLKRLKFRRTHKPYHQSQPPPISIRGMR